MKSPLLLNRPCTDFCAQLKALQRVDGKLPSYDDLVAQLGQPKGQRCSWPLGTWEELQRRDSCNLCHLVLAALSECRRTQDDVIDPGQEVSILLCPGEQAFRLSYPSFIDTRLAFVAESNHEASGPDNARPLGASKISPTLVPRWLRTCQGKHEQTCGAEKQTDINPSPDSDQYIFRVVDIELGCVRRMPLETEYVSLSYVWGQLPMFKLSRDNLDMLMTPGSLETIRENLPKTLNDAIHFVQASGLRYLWVDTLCLVQDDPGDVNLGVNLMGSIYLNSLCTIIAGSGVDADTGLVGVQSLPRTSAQFIVDIAPGMKMTATHSIDWHLSRSVYNKRGWTCQELVLPRRAVIFINNTVYFRCQSANWSEETTSDHPSWGDSWLDPDDFNISRIPSPIEGQEAAWWAYQKLNEDYSRRELRFDSDALRAVAGMARPLAKEMDTCMLQGLPLRYLDNALLFMSSTGDMRRRPGFASYSWAGWAGKVMWPRENYSWNAESKGTKEMPRPVDADDDDDDEGRMPELSGWMDSHTMVTWAVKTPEEKVYALFPFKRFRRSISLLGDLVRNVSGLSSEAEVEKLRNAGFGHLCYLTGDTTHYGSTFDLENISTDSSPSAVEMEKMTLANSRFNALFEKAMSDEDRITELPVSTGQKQYRVGSPQYRNWLATLRARQRQAKRLFHQRMATNATADKQQTRESEEAKPASVYAEEMDPLERSSSTINNQEAEYLSYHMQLKLLEDANRKRAAMDRKERDRRIAQAQMRKGLGEVPSTDRVASAHTMSDDHTEDPGRGTLPEETDPSLRHAQQSKHSPFPLLYFQTISFKLILGERKQMSSIQTLGPRTNEDQNIEHPDVSQAHWTESGIRSRRSLGSALLSRTGKIVGSLHLDTRDSQPGAGVECLVVARSSTPTFGSALREEDVGGRPILWVLHVAASGREEGVVERRGVGQVLVEALEEAIDEGKPEIKTVLLG